MKKLTVLLSATTLLFSASCTKKSTTAAANGWTLGGKTYTTKYSASSASAKQLFAMDATPSGSSPTANSCIISFSALPTAGGTFKVVGFGVTSTIGANELAVNASTYSPVSSYVSSGYDNVSATVTVTGGKIKVVLPSIWMRASGSTTDSVQLTGTIVEQ